MRPAFGPLSRREWLSVAAGGIGGLALGTLLAEEAGPRIALDPLDPLAVRKPHFTPKAKRIIFLSMYGGPSQVDTFDYKPDLEKLADKPVPESFKQQSEEVGGVFNNCEDKLLAGPWKWKQHGQGGLWISELFPEVARHADKLCVIKSMYCDSSNHAPATYQMNTGAILGGKPSFGSWLTYGLGSENRNLPGYVLLFKVGLQGGTPNWSNAFLPAAFAGTQFRESGPPVPNLLPPEGRAGSQQAVLETLRELNREHLQGRAGRPDLEGRIAAYELAYRMQAPALEVGDISTESRETLEMYGIEGGNGEAALFGRMCLQARRLSERGVRVVQLCHAVDQDGWDGHSNNAGNHRINAGRVDRPIAALLTDLERRGLLDETLVVWTGEFGRTPMAQGGNGRNHNPLGFSLWLAGGGVRGGRALGATDAIGLRAVEFRQHPKNIHATLLTAFGLRPDDLSFEHNGRPERLTGVAGSAAPIMEVFG